MEEYTPAGMNAGIIFAQLNEECHEG